MRTLLTFTDVQANHEREARNARENSSGIWRYHAAEFRLVAGTIVICAQCYANIFPRCSLTEARSDAEAKCHDELDGNAKCTRYRARSKKSADFLSFLNCILHTRCDEVRSFSLAYVFCTEIDSITCIYACSDLQEQVYPWAHDPEEILKCAEWMSEDTMHALSTKLLGPHPNTYTYTKRLAETLVDRQHGKLPVCIIRPSIVSPAFAEPVEGVSITSINYRHIDRSRVGNLCCFLSLSFSQWVGKLSSSVSRQHNVELLLCDE